MTAKVIGGGRGEGGIASLDIGLGLPFVIGHTHFLQNEK